MSLPAAITQHGAQQISASTKPVYTSKPLLRWAGSKQKVLPILAQYWNAGYRRYVEPFAGSAALFFRLQPRRAVLSDINEALIETYCVIRDQPDAVYTRVKALPQSEATYYRVRSQNPKRLSTLNRAVRFVYLNRFCFNGIYRTNQNGDFNVPYAHSGSGALPAIEAFRRCSAMLAEVTLRSADFGSILSATTLGDFVYLDPPYAVAARRVFREYSSRQFEIKDLDRLSRHLDAMHARRVDFVVSYADCRESRTLFRKWNTRRIYVRRHIAGFSDARRTAVELVATNIDLTKP